MSNSLDFRMSHGPKSRTLSFRNSVIQIHRLDATIWIGETPSADTAATPCDPGDRIAREDVLRDDDPRDTSAGVRAARPPGDIRCLRRDPPPLDLPARQLSTRRGGDDPPAGVRFGRRGAPRSIALAWGPGWRSSYRPRGYRRRPPSTPGSCRRRSSGAFGREHRTDSCAA